MSKRRRKNMPINNTLFQEHNKSEKEKLILEANCYKSSKIAWFVSLSAFKIGYGKWELCRQQVLFIIM